MCVLLFFFFKPHPKGNRYSIFLLIFQMQSGLMNTIVGRNEAGSDTYLGEKLRILKKVGRKEKEEQSQICATKHFSYFTLNSWAPFVKRREKTFSIF